MGYILDKKILLDVSNSLRARGDKVVLTHGAFDLFHFGHLDFLKNSKKEGDVQIVGVESDERIAKYKNPYRPIIPFKERMEIVASIIYVDFVFPIDIVFSKKDYIKMYKELSPNMVTFGPTFGASEYIVKDLELTKGIKYKRIDHLLSDHSVSTTEIIKLINTRGEFK